MIAQYVENPEPIYTQMGDNKIQFPKNVIVPYEKVNGHCESARNENVDFTCIDVDVTTKRMLSGPQSMTLMLTSHCVTNCKYCYADRRTPYQPLSTDGILQIVEQAKALNMSYVDMIGGEVFCHREWDRILKVLVDYDLMPSYISTKVPLTETQIKSLRKTGYSNVVQVSLDSVNDDILAATIGSRLGYAQKMMNSIRQLEDYGFNVQIDTILTKYNCNRRELRLLGDFVESLDSLVYWEIRVPELSHYSHENFIQIKADRPSIESVREYVASELSPFVKKEVAFTDSALDYSVYRGDSKERSFKGGACGALQSGFFVLPDGKVTICELMYWNPAFLVGDLREQSIVEVWNSPKAWAIYNQEMAIRSESRCASCKVLEFCSSNRRRCVAKVVRAYGDQNADFPDPRCVFAPDFTPLMKY